MKLTSVKDVFFDLDHTLWDFDKNSALTFENIFNSNQIDIDLKTFLTIYEPLNLNYWKLYREDKIDKASLRYGRLFDTFKTLKISISDATIHKLSEDYITNLTSFNYLFESTVEILEYLSPNYNLHIITNGFKEVQHGKLSKSKIDHYFDTVTNSEMVGVKKPNPKIFNHALEAAKANAEESVMVGDNYEADILGALNFGLDAICFNYHNEKLDNHIKSVNHLMELKKYL
ncbi:MAG: YjjG family noncanonical pyrimidine nucleotidase [Bacteroidia bacterium]|nr:YjjG family noncanonical pyrimidine nucleotidase [Bacteroidia bacterium]